MARVDHEKFWSMVMITACKYIWIFTFLDSNGLFDFPIGIKQPEVLLDFIFNIVIPSGNNKLIFFF